MNSTSASASSSVSASGDRLFRWVVTPLVGGLIRLNTALWRVRAEPRGWQGRVFAANRPVIYVFWHEDLINIAMLYLKVCHPQLAVMVSRSRDGRRLARIIQRLGMAPIRASSSRGAVQGMREMIRWLKPQRVGEQTYCAIALDGPRGPRREAKPGVIVLARKAGAVIVPMAFHNQRQWVFNSWDRTRLAKPFTRCLVRVGQPIDPQQWDGPDDARHAAELSALLNRMHD